MRRALERHAVVSYVALTFAISWGAIVATFGLGPIPPSQMESRGSFLYVALLLGPSVAGVAMVGLTSGREGYVDLKARLLRWRIEPRWWAFALLLAPGSIGLVLLTLSLVPGLLPDVFTSADLGARLGVGVAAGVVVAVFEEAGWTGFATPRLRERHGVFTTGALLGTVWGLWHFPPFWEADSFTSPLSFGLLATRLLSWLPPFRVCMVWLHERTQSLLAVVVMHACLVATQFVLVIPFEMTPTASVAYILTWAAVLWAVAAMVTRDDRSPG